MKALFVTALACLAPAFADDSAMKRVEPQNDRAAIPLYAGAAPGFETVAQKEVWTLFEGRERWIRNVTVPTLLPVLPKKNKATGASVELHYYSGGSHGFGAQKLGQPSDLWFE